MGSSWQPLWCVEVAFSSCLCALCLTSHCAFCRWHTSLRGALCLQLSSWMLFSCLGSFHLLTEQGLLHPACPPTSDHCVGSSLVSHLKCLESSSFPLQ